MKNPAIRHVVMPALAPVSVVALYFTPVLWFGCVNRGLLAVAICLASAAGAFFSIGRGFGAQARKEPAHWWLLSAGILTLPLALVIGPLG
jgi:hypothetical protein